MRKKAIIEFWLSILIIFFIFYLIGVFITFDMTWGFKTVIGRIIFIVMFIIILVFGLASTDDYVTYAAKRLKEYLET